MKCPIICDFVVISLLLSSSALVYRKFCGRNIPNGIRIEFRFIFSLQIFYLSWVHSKGKMCSTTHTFTHTYSNAHYTKWRIQQEGKLHWYIIILCKCSTCVKYTTLRQMHTRLIADSLKVHMPSFGIHNKMCREKKKQHEKEKQNHKIRKKKNNSTKKEYK